MEQVERGCLRLARLGGATIGPVSDQYSDEPAHQAAAGRRREYKDARSEEHRQIGEDYLQSGRGRDQDYHH